MSTTRSGRSQLITPVDGQPKEDKRTAAVRRKAKEKEEEEALRRALEAAALEGKTDETATPTMTVDLTLPSPEATTETPGAGKQPEDSPEKKKSKPSAETPVRSLIKQSRYRPSTPAPQRMHLHEHKCAIIEAGLALDSTN